MDLYQCPICERLSYDYIRCSICSKYACISCMQPLRIKDAYYESTYGELCPKEWEIYRIVCNSYVDQLACRVCYSARTLEILRTYPIETAGLLVNATLLPLDAIRARLSD